MNPPTNPIILPADALRLALAGLGRVLSRTITLPVLATVRVIRHRGTITLAATDLDLHLYYTHRTEHPPLTDLARALAEMRWAREPAEGICVPSAALRGAAKATGDILIAADRLTFSTAVKWPKRLVSGKPAMNAPVENPRSFKVDASVTVCGETR